MRSRRRQGPRCAPWLAAASRPRRRVTSAPCGPCRRGVTLSSATPESEELAPRRSRARVAGRPAHCGTLVLVGFAVAARKSPVYPAPRSSARAGVAQLVEQLICNQQVKGSSPLASSVDEDFASGSRNRPQSKRLDGASDHASRRESIPGRLRSVIDCMSNRKQGCGALYAFRLRSSASEFGESGCAKRWGRPAGGGSRRGHVRSGEVPKRPNGADCKSAGSRLRRFESSPLHHGRVTGRAGCGERQTFDPTRCTHRSRGRGSANQDAPTARRDRWVRSRGASSRLKRVRAGIAQLARARAFQARGRGFESRFPLHARPRRASDDGVVSDGERKTGPT